MDTHFARLARRFGWTAHTDPDKIERDIAAWCPSFGAGPTDDATARKLVKTGPLP